MLLLIFLLYTGTLRPQADSTHYLKIHFLYGSKPARGHKKAEPRFFGGLHGGHVSMELDGIDFSFMPKNRVHIFARRKQFHSILDKHETHGLPVYPLNDKVTTIIIPLTPQQYEKIILVREKYCSCTPYDYAFFGMRCASGAQDMLQQAGIVGHRRRFRNILSTFYPRKLRRRLLQLAAEKNYTVIRLPGRPERKWEKD